MGTVAFSVTETEIRNILNSKEFDTGGKWAAFPLNFANRVIRQIHMEMDIRAKLGNITATFTTSVTSITLGSTYFKVSDRFTNARVAGVPVDIIPLEELNALDRDHDDVSTAAEPTAAAIEGTSVFVSPLWAGELIIENIFTKPINMADNTENPDLPDDDEAQDVIIAGVLAMCFKMLRQFDMAAAYRVDFFNFLDIYRNHIDKQNSMATSKSVYF